MGPSCISDRSIFAFAKAMDRAFRIGQRRNVNVYRLVATSTVEEAIYGRQIYKQQQAILATEGTTEKRYFTGEGMDNRHWKPFRTRAPQHLTAAR